MSVTFSESVLTAFESSIVIYNIVFEHLTIKSQSPVFVVCPQNPRVLPKLSVPANLDPGRPVR